MKATFFTINWGHVSYHKHLGSIGLAVLTLNHLTETDRKEFLKKRRAF